MQEAAQPNLRRPDRDEASCDLLMFGFGLYDRLDHRRVLELGPGQYEFAERARAAGAAVLALDRDPAVLKLGAHRRFATLNVDFVDLQRHAGALGQFDGVFCRASFNAFWYPDPQRQREWVDSVCCLVAEDGWGWLAPANEAPADAEEGLAAEVLAAQRAAFEANGFTSVDVGEDASRYGVWQSTAIFTRGIRIEEHDEEDSHGRP